MRTTHSGRVVESWEGAVKEIAKNVGGVTSHDVVNRDGTYRITLVHAFV